MVRSSSGLSCYSCELGDPECGDPFNRDNATSIQCSNNEKDCVVSRTSSFSLFIIPSSYLKQFTQGSPLRITRRKTSYHVLWALEIVIALLFLFRSLIYLQYPSRSFYQTELYILRLVCQLLKQMLFFYFSSSPLKNSSNDKFNRLKSLQYRFAIISNKAFVDRLNF